MNDERYCCDGKCHQGRNCPRYSTTEDNILLLIKVVAAVVFISVFAGYLWAVFNG